MYVSQSGLCPPMHESMLLCICQYFDEITYIYIYIYIFFEIEMSRHFDAIYGYIYIICLYIYIYTYIYIYICIYIYIYIGENTLFQLSVCVHALNPSGDFPKSVLYIYIYIYIYVLEHVYICPLSRRCSLPIVWISHISGYLTFA